MLTQLTLVLTLAFSGPTLFAERGHRSNAKSKNYIYTPIRPEKKAESVDILKSPAIEEGKSLDFELPDGRKASYKFRNNPEGEEYDSAVIYYKNNEVENIALRKLPLTVKTAYYDKVSNAIYEIAKDEKTGKNMIFIYDTRYNPEKPTRLSFAFEGDLKGLTRNGNDFTVTLKDQSLEFTIEKNEKGVPKLQPKKNN